MNPLTRPLGAAVAGAQALHLASDLLARQVEAIRAELGSVGAACCVALARSQEPARDCEAALRDLGSRLYALGWQTSELVAWAGQLVPECRALIDAVRQLQSVPGVPGLEGLSAGASACLESVVRSHQRLTAAEADIAACIELVASTRARMPGTALEDDTTTDIASAQVAIQFLSRFRL